MRIINNTFMKMVNFVIQKMFRLRFLRYTGTRRKGNWEILTNCEKTGKNLKKGVNGEQTTLMDSKGFSYRDYFRF